MLIKIKIKNCFKHTNTEIDFRKGLTAIVGPNESGKSLIFEMVRFALFGTTALRGRAEDYKALEVELSFLVDDKLYTLIRGIKKADLIQNQNKIASGVKPVNQKVKELLGYDLDIFDIANCANQDELNKLATMKATERKSMVDNVIGLTLLDRVSEKVAEKARECQIRVAGLRQFTEQVPVAPARLHPEGYDSTLIRDTINQLEPVAAEVVRVKQWLETVPEVPLAPEPWKAEEGIPFDKAQIEAGVSEQQKLNARLAVLNAKFEGLKTPTLSKDDLNKMQEMWEGYNERRKAQEESQRFVNEHWTPEYLREHYEQITTDWDLIDKWTTRKTLEARGGVVCKSCGTMNHFEENTLQQYQELPPEPATPSLARSSAALNIAQWDKIAGLAHVIEDHQALAAMVLEVPTYTAEQLNNEKFLWSLWDDANQYREEYEKLLLWNCGPKKNYTSALHDFIRYENDMKHYAQKVEKYNLWQAEKAKNETYYVSYKDVPDQLKSLRDILPVVLVYENSVQEYESKVATHKQKLEELAAVELKFDQYQKAREGLKILRSKIKKHLVPSLNKVSSQLISQMTGGERNIIIIDEDFNITVDGQPLQTLSGSGKAVANLAIRIGLGQVLVNKKFSLFMADEIDGSMDADRAGYTAECLKRLTQNIKQLLLISHKRPEVDNYIELGKGK